MVGSGTKASGARYKLYQDSNRNGKFDASKGDAYVGSGAANKRNYSAFTSILMGDPQKCMDTPITQQIFLLAAR